MKKWTQPLAKVEKFEANEYVAACWTVSCSIPAEDPNGYDPFRIGDTGNLHRAQYCGAADAFVVNVDDNGIPYGLTEIKAGSTGGKRALGSTIYTDGSFTSVRDISTVQIGETIYFATSNGGRTWHHHGTVVSSENHS